MDPAEVDIRIDVKRPELPTVTCPAEVPRAAPKPEDFVLMDYVNRSGVPTARFADVLDEAHGLTSESGVSYRGNGWVLLDVTIRNLAGRPPWTPRDATLTGKGGVTLRARLVAAPKGEIGPGGDVRVLVVVDTLPASADLVFTVEVRGDGGRNLVIPSVTLPKLVVEGKQ
jgi:uncharacterized protein (TIGR02268 family)